MSKNSPHDPPLVESKPRLFQDGHDDDNFDSESQVAASSRGRVGMSTGLTALMLAPLLLLLFPLLLLLMPAQPVSNTAPIAEATETADTTESVAAKPAATIPDGPPINWQTSFQTALALSKKTGKPIMADFYADWCGPCKAMDAYTWTDPTVIAEAKQFISVKVNVDAPQNAAVRDRYRINPLPTILWADAQGNEKGRNEGALGPSGILEVMKQFR